MSKKSLAQLPVLTNGDKWMNSKETALYLRLTTTQGEPSVNRLRNLCHQGRIPFYKPFGTLMFKKSEVDRIIEGTRKGGWFVYQNIPGKRG